MKSVPNDKPRRPRRKRSSEIQVTSRYLWTDQDGVEHETDEAGLPPELRGADGRPQLAANHPAWGKALEFFYQTLAEQYQKRGSSLSRDAYWWLWDNERATMLDLYQRWLGVKEVDSASSEEQSD